jgi:hypothetical protein
VDTSWFLVALRDKCVNYTHYILVIFGRLLCDSLLRDNLWLTPDGGIVLGECKLFRNPEARRQVIVQALDYARAIAGLGYEELEAAVRKALGSPSMTLWSLVSGQTALEQAQFVDAISRRLRQSHFLVLIIGDGIQEGVESLTSYLQLHAGLHVGLALVDLSIWRDGDGPERSMGVG